MTHPIAPGDELLAGYVDGTLSAPRTRQPSTRTSTRVPGAAPRSPRPRAARAALARLPDGRGSPRARRARDGRVADPGGGAARARPARRAGTDGAAPRPRRPASPCVARPGAAQDRRSATPPRRTGVAAAAPPRAPVPVEVSGQDFQPDLGPGAGHRLRGRDAAEPRRRGRVGARRARRQPEANSGTRRRTPSSRPPAPASRPAFGQVAGTLVRLIQARFEGEPAYIGIYAGGVGDGQPTRRHRRVARSTAAARHGAVPRCLAVALSACLERLPGDGNTGALSLVGGFQPWATTCATSSSSGPGRPGYTAALYAARANLAPARAEGPRRRRPAHADHRRGELSGVRRRDHGPRADGADGEAGGAVRRGDPAGARHRGRPVRAAVPGEGRRPGVARPNADRRHRRHPRSGSACPARRSSAAAG